MTAELSVRFDQSNEFQFVLKDTHVVSQAPASAWLDEQFVSLGAEPLRASGKVLTADKVLAVAKAAGPERFQDHDWGSRFAANALGALGRSAVRVEVESMTITY
jgi:hypothetical protein